MLARGETHSCQDSLEVHFLSLVGRETVVQQLDVRPLVVQVPSERALPQEHELRTVLYAFLLECLVYVQDLHCLRRGHDLHEVVGLHLLSVSTH